MDGIAMSAHRFVWELEVDAIPKGMQMRHRCGNGLCVNVDHLYLITYAEKFKIMRDSIVNRVGGVSPSALSPKQVKQIRGWQARGWTQQRIANKFGVGQTTIFKVVNGKSPYKISPD